MHHTILERDQVCTIIIINISIATVIVINGCVLNISCCRRCLFLDENEEFFTKLKGLVEETYYANKQVPVTILAHSMGGPMSLIFLQRQPQKWKDKFINSLITLSAVWGGSVKALKVFAIGTAYSQSVLYISISMHLIILSMQAMI